jgi:hypothetical protein
MLNSPAFKKLSPLAHLVLVWLEMEYARSGGRENGDLKAPRRQLCDFCGCRPAAIKPALLELKALGFIKLKMGTSGMKGRTTRVGLTYLPKVGTDSHPTDEWAEFDTTDKVVRVNSRLETVGKRTAPVVPVGTTITVVPGETTMEPTSSNGCNAKSGRKSQINGSGGYHYLDSSNPAKSSEEIAGVVTMRRTG